MKRFAYEKPARWYPPSASAAWACRTSTGPADTDEGAATLRAALDAGVTLLDTGDFYGMGHDEMLIAATLRDVPRERYLLSVEFGALRGRTGNSSASIFVPVRSRPRWPIRSSGSAPTTSTSTVPPASIPQCRSRTRSARWPTS